jgi:peptidoglycan/xylan/chitin deacetylase (PgdA/CDA1 family)
VNRSVRHSLEWILVRGGASRIARARLKSRTLVLAYHNVLPESAHPAGDRSLHLPQREFASQLDILRESHDVVPLKEVLLPPNSKRPRVAITFDDAYSGALTAGVTELAMRGLPATFFVAPALLAGTTWWDELAAPATGVIPDDARQHALTVLGGNGQQVLTWAATTTAPTTKSTTALPRIGTEAELTAASVKNGITFGVHTWSHPNLCSLSDAELRSELERPHEWLRARFRNVIPWLSYPYGLCDDRVERVAADSGYVAALRIDGGWISPGRISPYAIPRLNVPAGISRNGFRLRLSGL